MLQEDQTKAATVRPFIYDKVSVHKDTQNTTLTSGSADLTEDDKKWAHSLALQLLAVLLDEGSENMRLQSHMRLFGPSTAAPNSG